MADDDLAQRLLTATRELAAAEAAEELAMVRRRAASNALRAVTQKIREDAGGQDEMLVQAGPR